MSLVKSLSVGNGDMFYIKHGSDSFTSIDCCMTDDNQEEIMDEIIEQSKGKGITRFISTHPDDDHFQHIEYYNERKSMGDIETDFLEKVKDEIDFEEIDVLFAPHHGRESGKIPEDILTVLNPKIVVIGEAKSKDLNYYSGYNTITQNSAGDITFDCVDGKVHIYVGSDTYSVDFLNDEKQDAYDNYIGSFDME